MLLAQYYKNFVNGVKHISFEFYSTIHLNDIFEEECLSWFSHFVSHNIFAVGFHGVRNISVRLFEFTHPSNIDKRKL